MLIHVDDEWQFVCNTAGGAEVRFANVFNEIRVIGRLVDLGDGTFRADYLDCEGDWCEVTCLDQLAALQVISSEALARHKMLH